MRRHLWDFSGALGPEAGYEPRSTGSTDRPRVPQRICPRQQRPRYQVRPDRPAADHGLRTRVQRRQGWELPRLHDDGPRRYMGLPLQQDLHPDLPVPEDGWRHRQRHHDCHGPHGWAHQICPGGLREGARPEARAERRISVPGWTTTTAMRVPSTMSSVSFAKRRRGFNARRGRSGRLSDRLRTSRCRTAGRVDAPSRSCASRRQRAARGRPATDPRAGPAPPDNVGSPAPRRGRCPVEPARIHAGERGCPGRPGRRDHTNHAVIVSARQYTSTRG